MSFNYSALKTTADGLLASFGVERTFTRTNQGAYNPATGQTSNTEEAFSKLAVALDYSDQEVGGAIERGDRKLIAQAYAYEVGDKVIIDDTLFTLINVSLESPNGTVVVANLQARK